jgi:polar amino acid transport system permease protein
VILPQAIVRMLPPLISSSISLIKASSLASAVGVTELMWQGNALMLATYRRVETYTVIAVMYFVLTYPQALCATWLHRRLLPKE